jgi:hypothetical protein
MQSSTSTTNTPNAARSFTPGPWQSQQADAAADAREAAQQFARENLRLDFTDAQHWRDLASAAGIRLPAWYVRCTAGGVRRYCARLGLDLTAIEDATGCRSYREFAGMNPSWPLFAVVGLLVELAHDRITTH